MPAHITQQQCALAVTGSIGSDQYSHSAFSEDVARLSRSFPSPWSISYELDLNMRQRIRDMLPPRAEAQRLCEQARRNAFWQ